MIHLYNTTQRKIIPFEHSDTVRIYVCGITPYDAAHLGHIFTFLAYDLLQRRLEHKGHTVQLVRNITDVDEPIYKRASENNEPYTDLAKRVTHEFQNVMKSLRFRKPFAQPLASEYIPQMIDAVQQLLKTKHAYRLENGDIYFDVSTFKDYSEFSGFSDQLQRNLMAMRGGDPERADKRNSLDFLLWKAIDDLNDPARWGSPMGIGRPGWHIECSVMSSELLSTPFDLHGGGMDLIFPHHACEVAQSVGLTGTAPTQHWMHVAPLSYHGEKMSKSLGNLVFVKDIMQTASPAAIRLALMSYHYRTGGEWRDDILVQAQTLERTLKAALAQEMGPDPAPYTARIMAALDNDLDTHTALHAIESFAASILVCTGSDPDAPKELHAVLDTLGIVLED